MFRSILLMAMAALAGIRTRDNGWLRVYFLFECLSNVPFLLAEFDIRSTRYQFYYTWGAIDVFLAGAAYTISRYKREGWWIRGYAIVEALVLIVFLVSFSTLFLHSYLKFLPQHIIVSLADSGCLLALGVGLTTVARRDVTAWALATMWLALAAYEYGFTWGFPLSEVLFHNLNQWLPCTIVCVAFGVIAWNGQNSSDSLARPLRSMA